MTEPNQSAVCWRIAGYELDEQLGALSGRGSTERLRPKTLAVLRYMLDHPGRLLSRSELLSNVWSDTVVTEDSLTQCIAEIRRACGDHDRTLIKTVPKRGFIFDAEVTSQIVPRSGGSRRAPSLNRIIVIIGILAVVAVGITLRKPWAPAEGATNLIAVTEIAPAANRSRSGATLLTEALRLRLDEMDALSIRGIGTESSTRSQLDVSRENAIDWLVTGDISTVPGGAADRVQIWLWQVDQGNRFSLGVFSLPASVDTTTTAEFLALRDLIVERALERLPGHIVGPAPSGFPDDLRDFETYASVMAALEQEQCNPQLTADIRPVVENTPTFVRGWMAFAWAAWVESWACGLGDSSLTSAIAAADRVLELRPNYPQAIKVKTSAMAAMGEVQRALDVATQATAESPDIAALWSTQSYLQNYVGDLSASEAAMDRALALDPLVLVAETGETPNIYLYVTKWQRYIDTQPPFDAPFFNFQRAYALFRLGDISSAERIASETRRRFPADLYSRFCTALLAVMSDTPERAINILTGITGERDAEGLVDGEVAYRESVLLLLAGAPDKAVERLWTSADQGFVCPDCVRRDPAWASLLADGALSAWLKRYDVAIIPD